MKLYSAMIVVVLLWNGSEKSTSTAHICSTHLCYKFTQIKYRDKRQCRF